MKGSNIAILFSLVSLLIASCSKMDQLFNNGEPITEQRNLGQRFNTISMHNNVNVRLVRDNHPHLELTCPKNLIEKVTTEIDGDTLFIKNQNDYNWLRSYDYDIDLTVYYDSLREIKYAAIGDLLCTDSITGIGELTIDSTEFGIDTLRVRGLDLNINEGSGHIDLTTNCERIVCKFSNGTSDVILRGRVGYSEFLTRSYGVIHAENLNSNLTRVQSTSTNDVYVWTRSNLTVWLYSIGNVYYKGTPEIVIEDCTSEGRVIRME